VKANKESLITFWNILLKLKKKNPWDFKNKSTHSRVNV
jgi:hypothetical protein